MNINTEHWHQIMISLLYHIGFSDNKPKDGIPPWSGYVGLYAKSNQSKPPHMALQMIRVFPDTKTATRAKALKSQKLFNDIGAGNHTVDFGISCTQKHIIAKLDNHIIVIINDDGFTDTALQFLTYRIALLVWEHDLVQLNVNRDNAKIVREFFKKMRITDTKIIKLFHDTLKSWKSKTQEQPGDLGDAL